MDWIEDIVENTYRNYKKRKVVLWGKYSISETIADRLKDIYGIETAFFVDKDASKIDNKQVFSTSCLNGKSHEYYVVVPVAYYKSLKAELTGGGYKKDEDYYYFCDCIVKMTDDYYEDSHGNKVIGVYGNLKFVFSGFNSVIKIRENAHIINSQIYVYNASKVEIGEGVELFNDEFLVYNNSEIQIGDNVKINNSKFVLEDNSCVDMKNKGKINKFQFLFRKNSKCEMGHRFRLKQGIWYIGKYAVLIIGDDFSINNWSHWRIGAYTSVHVKEDCMFSYGVVLQSHDGHSIFDVHTGLNINSSEEISRDIKVVIGNHVWIGARTIILYNTEIGDGSIIGAGSLVKGKIPNNCISAGVPAKVIKKDIAWGREQNSDELREYERKYARLTELPMELDS